MRHFVQLFLVLVVAASPALAQDEPAAPASTCASCHEGLAPTPGPKVSVGTDEIHRRRAISCVACHGGDARAETASAAHDSSRGFKGVPRGAAIVDLCGRCHSDAAYMHDFRPSTHVDQIAQYATSGHGRRLAAGDVQSATCASCHTAHAVFPVADARSSVFPLNVPATCGRCHADAGYMAGRKVPTDIVAKYRGSVHGRALLERGVRGAPACTSCHGSHGAAKPKADAVANLCGECHDEQATLFRGTRKRSVFDSSGVPECVVCHSNHDIQPPTDALLGTGPQALCSRCHTLPEDIGTRDAKRLGDAFGDVAPRMTATERGLESLAGTGPEMREAFLRLSEARRHLGRARVLIHSFDAEPVLEELKAADRARQAADEAGAAALSEWRSHEYFKYGAIGAVVLGSLALILCLWFRVSEAAPDLGVPRPALPHD